MNLLNLACGAVRVVDETWINMDNLHESLEVGTPERANLDAEPNYINGDITKPLPFTDGIFDGVLASHCIEHFDCHQGVSIMRECHRILKPGGILLVSVPDAAVFRQHHEEDTPENAVRLFGEPIHLPDGETTFLGYAGFNRFHKVLLSEDSLWCYFVRAGFEASLISRMNRKDFRTPGLTLRPAMSEMGRLLNRLPFSLIMEGTKS